MVTKLSQLMEKGYCVFDQALKKEDLEKIKVDLELEPRPQ